MGHAINDITTETTPEIFIKTHGIPSVDALKVRLERLRINDNNIGGWNKYALTPYQQQAVLNNINNRGQRQQATTTDNKQPQTTTTTTRITQEELQQRAEQQRQRLLAEAQRQQQEREEQQRQAKLEADRLERQQQYDHIQAIERQKIELEELKLRQRQEANRIILEQQQRQIEKEKEQQAAEQQRREEEARNIRYFGLTDCINYFAIVFALIGFWVALHGPGVILGLMLGLFQLLTIFNAKRSHRQESFNVGFWVTVGITVIYGIFHNFTFVEMLSDPSVKTPSFFTIEGLSLFLSVAICIIDIAALYVSRKQAIDDSTL